MIFTDDPKTVKKILKYLDICVILHNLLLNMHNEEVPDEWYEGWNVRDIVGNPDLERLLQNNGPKDERRTHLLDYLCDYIYGY